MYNRLKRITKSIVPKKLLDSNEFFFRKLISFKYKGNDHLCNICSFKLSKFVILKTKDTLCPNCGSRSRTRRLYNTLCETEVLKGNVLHFSPPKILYKKFKRLNINYFSSDFENEFTADYQYDITSLPIEDNYFDLIICYHILEHIENDIKAMSQLYRVLKPYGVCYIQTPYKDGTTYEDSSIISLAERERAFGQKDHVRIYSAPDLAKRLETVGFKIEQKHFEADSYFGFKKETVIIAKK
ncbi:class I SAM-dependent methyltransferase [Winogradskyella flava]|uniref:class I SAM-dependent methyltransferase n=1 Tax=Winogradskyella flava TaxID=1884876 RepID=UPI002492A7D2|nr:class I SAM-dependent methyltransferase [Winogradskyella flava]